MPVTTEPQDTFTPHCEAVFSYQHPSLRQQETEDQTLREPSRGLGWGIELRNTLVTFQVALTVPRKGVINGKADNSK